MVTCPVDPAGEGPADEDPADEDPADESKVLDDIEALS